MSAALVDEAVAEAGNQGVALTGEGLVMGFQNGLISAGVGVLLPLRVNAVLERGSGGGDG